SSEKVEVEITIGLKGQQAARRPTGERLPVVPWREQKSMTTTSMRGASHRPHRVLALSGLALAALCTAASAQQAPAAAPPASAVTPAAPAATAPATKVAPTIPKDTTSSIERSAQAPATAQAPPPAVTKPDVPPARKETPAAYMKRVGNELLLASRSGSVSQIAMVLSANADVPSIGLNALGDYARSLPKADRPLYYNGMINFIARYAAKEAPKYPIARFVVTAQSQDDSRGVYVDSHITLASGDASDVRWLIVRPD